MDKHIWDGIVQFVTTWGSNSLVNYAIGSLVTLLVVFCRQIGHALARFGRWLWAIMQKRGDDYSFEKIYLDWLIGRYQYLGLLPARTVAARWGEGPRMVGLEKVYVTLQVSTSGEDLYQRKTADEDITSWRKRPRWHVFLKYFSWQLSTFLLLIAVGSALASTAATAFSLKILSHATFFIQLFIVAIILSVLSLVMNWLSKRILREDPSYQPGDLGQAINRHKQLVIRGDPGSGKTTLLRYLAVTCARALRNQRKKGDVPGLVKERLLWSTRPFPMLVTLRRHNDVMYWSDNKGLINAFLEEIPPELRSKCPQNFFERRLEQGNCLILLDAFDELGSLDARTSMGYRIGNFLARYNQPSNRLVVTTRIIGYEGQLDQYRFQIRTVQKLQQGEIRALVKQRYQSVALSITSGWQAHDAAPVLQELRQRSEWLIKKIENTSRLAQLATNPLLLSLIVLIHYVKLELPEQRVQLYRECVEILTEQWQHFKQGEAGIQSVSQEDLTLLQKLALLQEIALSMQEVRTEENRQTLLPRKQVQEIIARKLPDVLGSQLPVSEQERREICQHRAEEWIKGIQVESGILVDQGLDEAGEALIGFSHLTFQEYLTAVAINETPSYQRRLNMHLMQPAWREVVLLYVALTPDATPIITHLLDDATQTEGVLQAGFCLAERAKYVQQEVQQVTLQRLKAGFEQASGRDVAPFGQALAAIGGSEVTIFMRAQLQSTTMEKRIEAVKALGLIRPSDPLISQVQDDLVRLVEMPNDVALVIAAREALAQVGDPRFTGKEPVVVPIPLQTYAMPSSPKSWKELRTSPEWIKAKTLKQRFGLIERVLDYWVFTKLHPRRRQLPQKRAFEIGKYLVTNIEYAQFVAATGYRAPEHWVEDSFPSEKATHPVTGINLKDANAYCKWLSRETGKNYRLPTEWEWEWTATGSQGWSYPWGEQFDKGKCNTSEAGIGETTPVGSYLAGVSQDGVADMSGNVWEMTQGYFSSLSLSLWLLSSWLLSLLSWLWPWLSLWLWPLWLLSLLPSLLPSLLLSLLWPLLLPWLSSFSSSTLRGGSFDGASSEATCFFRKGYSNSVRAGFRCVREV